MATQKPSIPKGTRDFSPQEMVRRNYIFDTIRSVYKKYGYLPIETPAMENTETLMGKYGEEGDRLIFRILNSANYLSDFKNDEEIIAAKNAGFGAFTNKISEKALRYDLTVPFARYVVMNQNEITFPFKRYQIQPVWRADRPQKGRYREFYQCDADVIGSNSLLNEVELVQIIDEVFAVLKVSVEIKINNRKILAGIAEYVNEKDRFMDIVIAIDKYEKIGDKIYSELKEKGFSDEVVSKLQKFMSLAVEVQELYKEGKGKSALIKLMDVFESVPIGKKGVEEIYQIFSYLSQIYIDKDPKEIPNLILDMSLARGLNYYTGAIFEVKALAGSLKSSICGGGRYDDLTGIFGLPNLSGVGISFGADRIYDVLNELNLYPEEVSASTKLLFVTFSEADQEYCLSILQQVRKAGIAAELYPDAVKMQKQMKYADAKGIPFVAIVGENERKENVVMLKNMKTGEQEKVAITGLIEKIA
ncbi:MAG: histidyl-tRNA synthetase [Bacteroidetes bacterium]|nr:MAG: histidyl-tRNA synthetase [Bacteroidota bacterium]